jgi:protocatechuate 3,4-dioxygenase beta subunit
MKAQNPGLTDAALDRRRALALCGGVGAAVLLGGSVGTPETVEAASCVLAAPAVTEGPYWVEEKLFRSDIRTDPTTGVARPGIRLTLTISLQNLSSGSCVPLAGAWVDVWHCDALGIYSDEPAYNPGGGTGTVVTKGQKFLRGYQISDDNGQVAFTTIYPGWYTGRTVHIHVRVRTYSGTTKLDEWVTQIFFSESDNNVVLAQAPYNTRTSARDTSNG